MKKLYTLLLGAVILGSCSLDKYPETTLGDTNFWRSEVDLRGACNRLYIDLPGFLEGAGHDLRSDELVGKTPDGISSGNRTVDAKSKDWSDPYNKIGVCNNIIVKGERAQFAEARKNRYLAEAHFFRAYHYFDLVKKYGDVPLVLKVFSSPYDPDVTRGRDPRETVIQQCYTDLDFAAKWLPEIDETDNDKDWGRVSRSAALAMIVRIGLYEGTYGKYHQLTGGDYKAHLKKSIDAAELMIEEDKHDLYGDFLKLFYFDGEGRKNPENVFLKVYGPNGAANATVMHRNSGSSAMSAMITRQMVDNFLYIDGLPRMKSVYCPAGTEETSMNDVFSNRDQRLQATVYAYDEKSYKDVGFRPFDNINNTGNGGYPIKKGYMESEANTQGKETVDRMIIRYAEVLLSYAEALYEYNGNITNDQLNATVNKVRHRAGFPESSYLTNEFAAANGLDIRDEIRRERMVEFIDEGIHYDDIIRWKTAEEVLPKALLGIVVNSNESAASDKELNYRFTDSQGMYNGKKLYDQARVYVIEEAGGRSFDPARDYLYPIPTNEIATSHGNIKQNPGW